MKAAIQRIYVKLKRRLADMSDCIFCKLANGDIPTDMVYQDDLIAVFRDAAPQAPVHMLMVPKIHVASLDDLTDTFGFPTCPQFWLPYFYSIKLSC